jgi:hypothetical protein
MGTFRKAKAVLCSQHVACTTHLRSPWLPLATFARPVVLEQIIVDDVVAGEITVVVEDDTLV